MHKLFETIDVYLKTIILYINEYKVMNFYGFPKIRKEIIISRFSRIKNK